MISLRILAENFSKAKRFSYRVALTKLCGTLNGISNRPREEKKILLANPSITEEVIINY